MTAVLAIDRTSDVGVAQAVLAAEMSGLRALSAALDDSFTEAVERLASCSGRVVVSGMASLAMSAAKSRPPSPPPAHPRCLCIRPRPRMATSA